MKIAVASSGLGHVSRGIEVWADCLGRALAERGEAVTLLKGAGAAEAPYEKVIPCIRRSTAEAERLARMVPRRGFWRIGLCTPFGVEQVSFAPGLLLHLRRERIDVLHVQDPPTARIAQWARRLGWIRTRTILAHGTDEPAEFLRKITYLQHLAPCHLEEARAAGAWKPTWTAIPNFVDTVRFQPDRDEAMRAELEIPPDGLVVLTAAAIVRRVKRIDYLIEEFARLRADDPGPPAWLVIAGGRTPDTEALRAEGLAKLGERVRFLVDFPPRRMPKLYRMADVFVLCSSKEMMPIALLEAMASGLPCLVHRDPVVEWTIGPGGETIDMLAPCALASALAAILSDPSRRARLGRLARWHCVEHFGRDRVVDQILDYYRTVLTHDRPRVSPRPAGIATEPAR